MRPRDVDDPIAMLELIDWLKSHVGGFLGFASSPEFNLEWTSGLGKPIGTHGFVQRGGGQNVVPPGHIRHRVGMALGSVILISTVATGLKEINKFT